MTGISGRRRALSRGSAAIALFALILAAGCSDNPVDAEDQPVCDHVDADGLVVELGDQVLASQWRGVVSGEIELEEGESLTGVSVVFLDADSSRVVVDEACVDHSLGWTIGDEDIVEAAAHASERWMIDLTPRGAGETTIRFRVLHGDHADFTSLPFDVHVHEHGDEHAEAEGVILRRGGLDLVTVWQGVATGQLEVEAGTTTLPIDVVFLDAAGDEFTPHGDHYRLGAEIDDTARATLASLDAWTFSVAGVAEGTTSLSVSVVHDGHSDFTAAVPLVVLPAGGTPEALAVREGGTHLVSWNYDGERAPSAEGVLVLTAGEERPGLGVHPLGDWIAEPGHGGSHRNDVRLANGRYHVEWQVADPGVAMLGPAPGDPWGLEATGVAGGSTTVVVRLLEGATTVLESAPLPVVVVTPGAGDADADYFLKKNGVRTVYVVDGQLVAQPAGCGAPAVGQLEADAGEETDLFLLKNLDQGCGQTDVAGGRLLSFRVADPTIAAITNHPIHWGERTDFHVKGLTAGTTSLTMYLVNASTLEIELVSPALPVVIGTP
jgi:hypothetical protein